MYKKQETRSMERVSAQCVAFRMPKPGLLYLVLVPVLKLYLRTFVGYWYWYLYLHAKYWYLYWYLNVYY